MLLSGVARRARFAGGGADEIVHAGPGRHRGREARGRGDLVHVDAGQHRAEDRQHVPDRNRDQGGAVPLRWLGGAPPLHAGDRRSPGDCRRDDDLGPGRSPHPDQARSGRALPPPALRQGPRRGERPEGLSRGPAGEPGRYHRPLGQGPDLAAQLDRSDRPQIQGAPGHAGPVVHGDPAHGDRHALAQVTAGGSTRSFAPTRS